MNGYCYCEQCSRRNSCPIGKPSAASPLLSQPSVQSWNDLATLPPRDPLDLIAWADISGCTVQYTLSDTFIITSGSWTTSGFAISSTTDPSCVALGSDNLQNVADAQQWNFQHLTAKAGDTLIAPPLRKLIVLRAGTHWKTLNQVQGDLLEA